MIPDGRAQLAGAVLGMTGLGKTKKKHKKTSTQQNKIKMAYVRGFKK